MKPLFCACNLKIGLNIRLQKSADSSRINMPFPIKNPQT